MGLFSGAKAHFDGQKAIKIHVAANQLANEGKPGEARAKYSKARELYERALSDGELTPSVHQAYAILLMRLGEFDRSMEVMRGISRMRGLSDSDWFDLRLNYSIGLWKAGDLDGAIATAKRAAQIKKCASLYSTLGMYLVKKAAQTGDFTEAEAFNAESMEYDDEDAGILDNMGEMYEAMAVFQAEPEESGECRAKAMEYYARAHAAKPRQITTIYSLARMYHEDGRDDEARKVLSAERDLYYSAVCSVSEEAMDALRKEIG